MIFIGQHNELFFLSTLKRSTQITYDKDINSPLTFLWTKDEKSIIYYEGNEIKFKKNTIICLSDFYNIDIRHCSELRSIKFNREFYCILDHDREVSCKGILFYGAKELPTFQIPTNELEKFEVLWKMFEIEMQSKDDMQLEMLQSMLKRFIILCTRIYKKQNSFSELNTKETDIVREYNYLVEIYFKTKHTVHDYADMLNKSPKTLSNLFAKLSDRSPLQIIQDRKMLEARRMLRYTDKTIKEIAYDLGFEDVQTFSRFFKKQESISPINFRNNL